MIKSINTFEDVKTFKFDEITDDRGFFLRVFDESNIDFTIKQVSFAKNFGIHTLRGMHFQKSPFSESKIITCTEGLIFDVAVDIQKNSPTFGQHKSYILGSNQLHNSVFIPNGFAHGYLTLTPKSSLIYFMDMNFNESHAFGFAWDDKEVGIDWPYAPRIMSDKDRLLGKMKTIL